MSCNFTRCLLSPTWASYADQYTEDRDYLGLELGVTTRELQRCCTLALGVVRELHNLKINGHRGNKTQNAIIFRPKLATEKTTNGQVV